MKEKLESLLEEIKHCNLCAEKLPLGANPVLSATGSAKILVAGQAPGIRVHKTGIPFNDPSGDRLREWMGLDRETFYDAKKIAIVPMGFCYPGTGKSGDNPPRPECAIAWRKRVLEHLPNICLTVAIGQYAQNYHLGKSRLTLTNRVKGWKEYWPDILPIPHPSPRNNIWLKKNPWFEKEVIPVLQKRISNVLAGLE